MVRHCAVPFCKSTDLTILCHRFPKRKDAFEQWKSSLQLEDIDTESLMQRFVVCTLHFKSSDYRNCNSRMLNSVAIPTLTCHDKAAFYDLPTTTIGTGAGQIGDVRSIAIPPSLSSEDPITEIKQSTESSPLIIERLETLDDDCTIYFLEEEPVPTRSGFESNDGHETSSEEAPDSKRIKIDEDISDIVEEPDEDLNSELIFTQEACDQIVEPIEYRSLAVQTDHVEVASGEDQLQRRMIEEFYPQYADYSRLDLAKKLKEKEDRLTELTKKLANFETAHVAMMKTMEAFKTLVN